MAAERCCYVPPSHNNTFPVFISPVVCVHVGVATRLQHARTLRLWPGIGLGRPGGGVHGAWAWRAVNGMAGCARARCGARTASGRPQSVSAQLVPCVFARTHARFGLGFMWKNGLTSPQDHGHARPPMWARGWEGGRLRSGASRVCFSRGHDRSDARTSDRPTDSCRRARIDHEPPPTPIIIHPSQHPGHRAASSLAEG